VASRNNGALPLHEDLAFSLRMDEETLDEQVGELAKRGLLDRTDDGLFAPHNWDKRQFNSDTSAERTRLYRERHKHKDGTPDGDGGGDVTVTVDVTPPDTDTDTEAEQKERTREDALRLPNGFAEFWDLYPNKIGKQAAANAFRKALKRTSLGNLLLGLRAYVGKADDRPWCNPATWLNQGRWDDAPAQTGPPGKQSAQDVARALQEWTNAHDPGPSNVYPLLPSASSEPDPHPDRLLSQRRV
jgi:hypothetical protein